MYNSRGLANTHMQFEELGNFIVQKSCKNIIVLTGAGISTGAGIPDFRSPSSGLHDIIKSKYGNSIDPNNVFTLDFYKNNFKIFFEIMRPAIDIQNLQPTIAHMFIRLLSDKGILLRNYSQNIDGLEIQAGVPIEKLVESHGSLRMWYCLDCGKNYSQISVWSILLASEEPLCTCGGLIRPDIVFYMENLPEKFKELSKSDFKKCDLLIVIGTSLLVKPFASLVFRVRRTCQKVLINKEPLTSSASALPWVTYLGDCNVGLTNLMNNLAWTNDFQTLETLIKSRFESTSNRNDKSKLFRSNSSKKIKPLKNNDHAHTQPTVQPSIITDPVDKSLIPFERNMQKLKRKDTCISLTTSKPLNHSKYKRKKLKPTLLTRHSSILEDEYDPHSLPRHQQSISNNPKTTRHTLSIDFERCTVLQSKEGPIDNPIRNRQSNVDINRSLLHENTDSPATRLSTKVKKIGKNLNDIKLNTTSTQTTTNFIEKLREGQTKRQELIKQMDDLKQEIFEIKHAFQAYKTRHWKLVMELGEKIGFPQQTQLSRVTPSSVKEIRRAHPKNSIRVKKHGKTFPTRPKSLLCSYCSSKFAQTSHLRQHERTHTGEKPFKCPYCTQSFSQTSLKSRHITSTHWREKYMSGM